ncbi:MAG: monovalent cation/H(+) antiporter subunit G [Granulosicoccus sp.]
MFELLIQALSWVLIAIACVFIVSGGVGLARMPDFYTRLHAASLTDTGGAMLLALALLLQAVFIFENPMAAIKIVLILFFTLFTGPTASHALAKTALLCGRVPVDAAGKPLLKSSEAATQMARSRPDGYRSGQDTTKISQQHHDVYKSARSKK